MSLARHGRVAAPFHENWPRELDIAGVTYAGVRNERLQLRRYRVRLVSTAAAAAATAAATAAAAAV